MIQIKFYNIINLLFVLLILTELCFTKYCLKRSSPPWLDVNYKEIDLEKNYLKITIIQI